MARPRSRAPRATPAPAKVQSKDRATSSVAARRAVLKRIKDEGVEHVLFWFTDLEGHLKSFAITPREMEGALDDGMGFDGSSITGFNRIEESDMVAIPDPATFQMHAAAGRRPRPRARLEGRPHDLRRRQARRHAVRGRPALHPRARARADEEAGLRHVQRRPGARVLPLRGRQGHETIDEGGYFAMTVQDAATEVRNDTIARARVGRDPDRVPPPRGRPVAARDRHALRRRARDGRQDDDLPASSSRRSPPGTATTRPSCRSRSSARTARACTPTCRCSRAAATSSSTRRTRTTCRRRRSRSSPGCSCTRARCRPCSPSGSTRTSGSCPGYEAPVYVAWSQRNRSALIRIPLYKPGSEQATRAEIRCPDPACNPYLAFAALLHAGLEGIEQGYELPDEMTTNLYRLSDEEREEQGVEALPGSLGEAIEALAGSELMQKALGEHIFPRYVELKRSEWDEYRIQVSEWEKRRYLAAL